MVDVVMEVKGIWPMREYVRILHTTILDYVAGRPMYEMCTGEERMEGFSRLLWWWDQDHGPTQAEQEVGLKIGGVYY